MVQGGFWALFRGFEQRSSVVDQAVSGQLWGFRRRGAGVPRASARGGVSGRKWDGVCRDGTVTVASAAWSPQGTLSGAAAHLCSESANERSWKNGKWVFRQVAAHLSPWQPQVGPRYGGHVKRGLCGQRGVVTRP